jgi:hypothetical protein
MLLELKAFSNISHKDELGRQCKQRAEVVISELEDVRRA